jgi:hypothetical protein
MCVPKKAVQYPSNYPRIRIIITPKHVAANMTRKRKVVAVPILWRQL